MNIFKTTIIILVIFLFLLSACEKEQVIIDETTVSKGNIIGSVNDTIMKLNGRLKIQDIGEFDFDPRDIVSLRDDIFNKGYFSIFDILVYLNNTNQIEMEYYFDEKMDTHVITSLDDQSNWWYEVYYDGGWRETSVFRMDHYPYKDKMTITFLKTTPVFIESVYETYIDEVKRKKDNDGLMIIPHVIVNDVHYKDVEVKAHNLRSDMFKPGIITAIDTIMSLGDAGLISYDLQWYETIGTARIVKSYWVNRIDDAQSIGRCGFVYEAGDERFIRFTGNHIHLPSDIRVITSPMYVEYFWICI